jgi:hypothetical protein
MFADKDNVSAPLAELRETVYENIPWSIGALGLREALTSLRIKREDGIYGTLVLKNGYVLFQPDGVTEMDTIPAALRYGRAYGHLQRVFNPEHGLLTAAVPPPLPALPVEELAVRVDDTARPVETDRVVADEGPVDSDALFTKAMADIAKWVEYIQLLMTKPKGSVPKPARSIPEKGLHALRWVISWMSSLPIEGIRDDVLAIATTWFIDNLLTNEELYLS